MTKRDFELIAEVIASAHMDAVGYTDPSSRNPRLSTLYPLAEDFATRLRGVNPRFDRARFMAACGFKGEG